MATVEQLEIFRDFSEIELLLRLAENIIEESGSRLSPALSQDSTRRRSAELPPEQLNSTREFGPLDNALNNANILLDSFSQNINDMVDSLIASSNGSHTAASNENVFGRSASEANTLPIPMEQDDDVIFVSENYIPVVDLRAPRTNNRALRRTRNQNIFVDDNVILIEDFAPPPKKNPKTSDATATPLPKPKTNESEKVKRTELENKPPVICSVCMESVMNKQPTSTICGHIFCLACIATSIQFDKKCPICKHTLNKKKFHRIYF